MTYCLVPSLILLCCIKNCCQFLELLVEDTYEKTFWISFSSSFHGIGLASGTSSTPVSVWYTYKTWKKHYKHNVIKNSNIHKKQQCLSRIWNCPKLNYFQVLTMLVKTSGGIAFISNWWAHMLGDIVHRILDTVAELVGKYCWSL